MAFSDEDFKRLKMWIENDPAEVEVHANEMIPSLLARLECAEKLIEFVDRYTRYTKMPDTAKDLFEAWHAASGKTKEGTE